MNSTWRRGFEIAKAASENSIAPRHARKVGAALFSGPILLSLGHNDYSSSHPLAKPGHNLHAEHRALLRRQHYDQRNNLILYVYRELQSGVGACSRPCLNCQKLMREAKVRLARFINEVGKMDELRFY